VNPHVNNLNSTNQTSQISNNDQVQEKLDFPFELASQHLVKVDEFINSQAKSFDPSVEGYVNYVCEIGGKRIRPALAIITGGSLGEINDNHIKIGAIIELVHLATLIHDDIMDEATIRREMPTASAKWGPSLSVLLGDCLFARALELAATFDDPGICRAVADAASSVCQGEIIQTQRRFDLTLTREEYFNIIELKTGALFAVASQLGAKLSNAPEIIENQLKEFGLKIGTAYQIYDDCIDLVGQEIYAGKTLGTDLEKGKLTLPLLNLISSGTDTQKEKLNEMILLKEPIDTNVLAGIADYDGAIERALITGKSLVSDSRDLLNPLDNSPYKTALIQITNYLEKLFSDCH
jgi:octaprenyl-diphosphate synthase